MPMDVVPIRHVRVRVPLGFMPMEVAVRPGRHQGIYMAVVAVIVRMRMFMLHRLICLRSAYEGGEGEHRARTRCAAGALCEQVETQAQPIAGRTDQELGQRWPEGRPGFTEDECQQPCRQRAQRSLEHHDVPSRQG
jgi:hypothetical protein